MRLCRPGIASDPCTSDLAATTVAASGTTTSESAPQLRRKPVDCSYVYPTVSSEPGLNSDVRVQAAEVAAAKEQASRFSSVCNVWAPMCRQRTLRSLAAGLGADKGASPAWGYHVDDFSLALGNLASDAADMSRAFLTGSSSGG